ncbi:MAG: sensor histidine kinase [Gammaproteobacteria bacterium]|nr:MAG: sensor histidine kinase [Gammaproteobacteria bacterium]
MFKTLAAKLAAVLLGLLCLIGALYSALTFFSSEMYQQEVTQKLNWKLAEHLVSEKTLMLEDKVNQGALDELFKMLMVINPNIEIYLLNTEGAILACSVPVEQLQRKQVALAPLKNFMEGSQHAPILGDDPRDTRARKIFSVSRVPVDGVTQGYLYVVLGGQAYDSVAQMLQGSHIVRMSTWALAASLVLTLLAGLLLFRSLTRRLTRLAVGMESFQRTELRDEPSAMTPAARPSACDAQAGGDEIDRLGASFNQMAARIKRQMDALKETDTLRRELVANVSHDLRTPLASLQGYLETLLLKEGELSAEEQRHYLEIACRHSEKLGRLVEELFELAKLDSNAAPVRMEPFALDDLAQDVAQKFQLAARDKGVVLEVICPQRLPLVQADIGLMERVLANLIENALRYTPAGGRVTLGLSHEQDAVTVRMQDTGCGIPQEDLPHVFERFYRVEKTRQEHTGGAGLGLAIAKRILDLHGAGISVESSLNAGTTFTFKLPAYAA